MLEYQKNFPSHMFSKKYQLSISFKISFWYVYYTKFSIKEYQKKKKKNQSVLTDQG